MHKQTVTLTGLIQPDKRITAIKALRSATRPPAGTGRLPMGLKDAKDIVDNLAVGHPAIVEDIYNTEDLNNSFVFVAAPRDENVIPREDVLDLILDVLSFSDFDTARTIMAQPSYQRVAGQLR